MRILETEDCGRNREVATNALVLTGLPACRGTGSYSEMGSEKFSNTAKSGYNKGTIRSDIRYLVVSKDVRRHRLISIVYITTLPCHGRGREFESRRPRHFFSVTYAKRTSSAVGFQPELQPEIHSSCPIWMFRHDSDGIQILSLSFNLLPVHRMDIACSRLLPGMTKHRLNHRRMNFI